MDADEMTITIKIILPDDEVIMGKLSFTSDGPKITTSEDSSIESRNQEILFSITDSDILQSASVDSTDRIEFDSLSFLRQMATTSTDQQDYYPPSTKQWVTFLTYDGIPSRINLQRIKGRDRYLLSSVDMASENTHHLHSINSYEANILKMETDWDYYNRIFSIDEDEEVSLDSLLDAPAPPWTDFAKLVEGVNVPNLERHHSMGETLTQLVPTSFPENVRLELIVFLAWTLRVSVPKEDPLDFLNVINRRFKSGPLLRSLVFGHIQCLIQGIPPPQYVRILALAERGSLSGGLSPTTEDAEYDAWSAAWYKIMESFPDRKGRIISLAHELNLSQEIQISIPITRKDASKSNDAWLDRFSLIRSNFLMRGYVQDSKIGLSKVVYVGGAHRWPHRHLQYTARLGNPSQKPPYIQVMVMPKTAFERLVRTKQNMHLIDWTASRLNYNLYNSRNNSWKFNASHFVNSFSSQRTKKQLDREFNVPSISELLIPNEHDAKVLDLLSWSLYPQVMERGSYKDLLQIDTDDIQERIEFYLREKIIHLQYLPTIYGFASVCIEIQGPISQVYSTARASLKHLPSATVMVSTSNKLGIIMARVPEKDVYNILVDLPSKANDHGLVMKGYRVSAYAGYVHNLYQRLLRPDGTWDDDVSDLLSQIRS